MPSKGSGSGATLTSIETISKQIEMIAVEAQAADLSSAAGVLRAMAELIRSLNPSAAEVVSSQFEDTFRSITTH